MAHTFIRVRVSEDVYRRFKIHCINMDVSIPKQITELVRKFVEIQDENEKLLNI